MRQISLICVLLGALLWPLAALAQEGADPPFNGPSTPLNGPAPPVSAPASAFNGFAPVPGPPASYNNFTTRGYCFPWILYESPYETTYFRTEAIAFRRTWETAQPIATLNSPTNAVLGTHDLAFTYQPGLSLLLGRRLNPFFAIEAGFIGLLQWDESRSVTNLNVNSQGTAGNLFSPFSHFGKPPEVGLDYNTSVSIHTTSTFNTGELNLRQRFDTPPSQMQASGIYGFRYFNVHEKFDYRSRSGSPAPVGTDNAVDVTTNNNLFGIQIGGTLEFRVEPRGWLNFEAKGFMCHNGANQDTQYTVGPSGGTGATVNSGQAKGRAAFGADVEGSVVWQFTPHIVGRVGYQCIFIDGLALAADNFSRNAPLIPAGQTEVFGGGHLCYHGPFSGLTVTW